MAKKSKTGKARKDKFYFLAKETGYRSRAAFKLIQLNRRFNFLNTSKILIDLCAAPGGWLQVASKEMPVSSQIIGVDLVPIQAIPRVKTFVADITTERCKQLIRAELMQNKADVVLHDGAPNVGTAWSIDEYSQANLSLQAFALATDVLRPGGWFITKVFRSRDYEPFKWVLSHFFRTVRAVKPEASRMESAEIFLVGQHYRAPDRIDHRFLDPRHVFGEVEVPKERAAIVSSLLKDCKKRKKAEGYADGDKLYHELPVSTFLHCSDPLEALAKANKVIFDIPEVINHPLTTNVIKTDLDDIQVLGKADIKNLLKWRKHILVALDDKSKSLDPVQQDKAAENSEVKEDEDLEVEEEVQRLIHEEEKQKKKRLKRVRKAKMKLAERLVLKMEHQGDHIEQVDDELFSLSTLHDFVGLEEARKLIGDTSMTGADAMARDEIKKALKEIRDRREEERRSAIEGGTKVHFSKRGDDAGKPDYDSQQTSGNTHRDDLYLSSEEDDEDTREDENESDAEDVDVDLYSEEGDDAELHDPNPKRARFAEPITRPVESKRTALPQLDGFNAITKPRNPLLVDLDDAPEKIKQKRKIESWLDSEEMKDLLAPVEEDDSFSTTSSDSDEPTEKQKTKGKKKKKAAVAKTGNLADIKRQAGVLSKGPAEEASTKTNESNVPTVTEHSVQRLKRLRRPLTPEERALALRLIRSAKSRRELLESAYHRMQFFEDPSDLPDWFVEDERIHMRKPLPLTKEEVSLDRPIQGRSMTKVEEAKARKKARLAKRLKRIRKKAEGISDDVPEAEKWQQIKQMYKKAGLLNKKRRPLHLIVNTKGGARNKTTKAPRGAKVKIVDRRMKADLRARDRGAAKGRQRGGRTGRPVRLLAHKPRRGGRRE
ncbi:hypothetical protein CRM22_006726 [Opisthorchis felineus]|uniref:Putative rRNA methyltransferase n=1 Tax=Opisthorchis felineus TaxID=147828 RepID=A0A4S2LRW8_OPIFE|nr:hypothetical protein CRM22_006726 [Opisthorchis felineus]